MVIDDQEEWLRRVVDTTMTKQEWPNEVVVLTPTYIKYRTVSPDGERYEVEVRGD